MSHAVSLLMNKILIWLEEAAPRYV